MKKLVSIALGLTFAVSSATLAYAKDFSDLPSDHWAYTYVDSLVASGTINGFEDGTFRPNGTVTRAEFVKMIGNGPTRRAEDYEDVPTDHWAYEYIMTSGLGNENDKLFNPSTPITRGDVAVMLWQRAGSEMGVNVPENIYSQGDNHDAISWVYTNNIMRGNDNVSLRLTDTLTRAEASALIIRSREVGKQPVQKEENINTDILPIAYKAFGFVDKEYSADANLTNGEMAKAAAIIQSGTNKPLYPGLIVGSSFEHEYAMPLNMICRYVLGFDNDNADFADKNATVKDSIATLMFAAKSFSATEIKFDENGGTYPGTENESKNKLNYLKCAYQNGITVDAELDSEITLADFTSLLIQLDGLSGFQYAEYISDDSSVINYKLNTDLSSYPSNAENYARILSGIPKEVYEAPYADELETPADVFYASNQLHELFDTLLKDWQKTCSENGVKIAVIYNPVFINLSSTGYVYRIQVEIIDKGDATTLADIVSCADETIGSKALENGDKFFVDIDTNTLVNANDLHFYVKDAIITKVIQ